MTGPSDRSLVLIISQISLIVALGFTALGSVIISFSLEASKEIGRVIYQAYGGQILDGINQALPGQNSEKYKRELVYDVIGDVIHKVLVDDIGNTLWSTVWGCGIAVLILALIQVVANTVLLLAAVTHNKSLVPSSLVTRLVYLSTYWGSIDAYRNSLHVISEEDDRLIEQ